MMNQIPIPSPTTLRETAETVALHAGKVAQEKWRRPRQLSQKGFRDIVTDADFAVQKEITDMIRARFPDHGFLTEEDDSELPAAGPVIWVIDPIDGTTNFSRSIPIFCISIAAVAEEQVQAGVIYDPMRDELFSTARGQGATLNKQSMQTSSVGSIGEAVVALDWSSQRRKRQTVLNVLNQFVHDVFTIRGVGSAALALAWVAAGRLDGFVNFNMQPWDIAAGSLLVEEAGGQLTHVEDRKPWQWSTGSVGCMVSNGRIHQHFLTYLASR